MRLIAILRGVTPDEVVAIGECLVRAGIGTIEVPLNSPRALDSIRLLHGRFATGGTVVGAGTVMTPRQVDAVAGAGATLVLSPDTNPAVVAAAKALGLVVVPGVATVTEALRALDAGADALKLFPADVLGTATLKAWRSVMAPDVRFVAVGGIDASNAASFLAAGAVGVGVGGSLYRPGWSVDQVRAAAERLVAAVAGAGAAG